MKNTIDAFVKDTNIAIVGVSRNKNKWGNVLFHELTKKGYTIYPVNPNCEEIDGEKCYHSIDELPSIVGNAIFTLPFEVSEKILKESVRSGIKRAWFHKGAGGKATHSDTILKFCEEKGIEVVYGLCPMMFFPPAGFHKMHFWVKKIFGRLPEDYVLNHA